MSTALQTQRRFSGRFAETSPRTVALLFLVAIALGIAAAQSGVVAALAIGALLGPVVFFVFADFSYQALLLWVAVSGLAHPFLRLPPGKEALITFDRIWIGAMSACLILNALRVPRNKSSQRMLVGLALLLVAYGLRAFATTDYFLPAAGTWAEGIFFPAVAIAAASRLIYSPNRFMRLVQTMMIAGGVLSLLGIAQFILGFEWASLSGGTPRFDPNLNLIRISGPYHIPEVYGLVLVMTVIATVYWMQVRGPAARFVGASLVLLQLTGIALTFFRATLLAAILGALISVGLRPGRKGRAIMAAAAVTFVGIAFFSNAGGSQVIQERISNTSNIYARFATYRLSFELFFEEPLFGVGVERFPLAFAAAQADPFSGVGALDHPHSTFFAVLVEQGLFGTIPLLLLSVSVWLVIRAYRRAARTKEQTIFGATVAGAAVAYLLMSLTLNMLPYLSSNIFFGLFVGATAARLDHEFATELDSVASESGKSNSANA